MQRHTHVIFLACCLFVATGALKAQVFSASPSTLNFSYSPNGSAPTRQNLTINSSPSGFSFHLYASNPGFVSFIGTTETNAGTTSTTFSIGIDTTVAPTVSGTYALYIFYPDYTGSNSPVVTIPVGLTVGGSSGGGGPNINVTPS